MSFLVVEPFQLLQKVAQSAVSTNLFGLNTTPTPDNVTAFMWSKLMLSNVTCFFSTVSRSPNIIWCMFGALKSNSPLSANLFGLNATPTPDNVTAFMWIVAKPNTVTCLPLGGLFDHLIINPFPNPNNNNNLSVNAQFM